MTETTFDEGALHSEYASVLSEEPTSTPDVPSDVPAAESHSADPAAGSHPEATPDATSPDSSPAGSHPEGQQPAAAANDPEFLHALELAGIKDPTNVDPKVLAKKLVEYNQRLSDQAKELKARSAGQPPAAAAPVTPTNEQPAAAAPVATPPAPVAAPVAPVVPSAPPANDADIETRVTEAASKDAEYMGFSAALTRLEADAAALVSYNEQGQLVGELPALDAEIAAIKNFLNPPEALKKAGIPTPELDEFDRTNWENKLARLEIDRSIRVSRLQELQFRRQNLQQRKDSREQQIRQHFQNEREKAKRDEEREQGIETSAQRYQNEWTSAFKAVTSDLKVEEGDLPEFHRMLHVQAKADPSVLDDIKGFMTRVIKAEQERLDKEYRKRQARNDALKRADNTPSAPTGAAAVAPPLPTATQDWEESLYAAAASERRSRAQG